MISSQVGTAWAHSQISEQLTLNCHTLMRQHFLPFQVIRKFIERYSYLFNCSSWALLRKLYLLFLSAPIAFAIRRGTAILATWWLQWNLHSDFRNQRLYSSVVERQSCKLKVLGSIPSGGFSCYCINLRTSGVRYIGLTPISWPCGLMDKALVFGTKDCRFESCQGHF